jgi:hypothetical protein
VDRGHRRRGREPRSLDRGGAATEASEGNRQVNRRRVGRERGSRVRVRMRVRAEGLRGGPHGASRRGGKGHGVGYRPRPGCPRGAGRAVPAHVPGQRPRHGLLHWAVPARAHPIRAGPGANRAKKMGLGPG